jgi:hypothetical protein
MLPARTRKGNGKSCTDIKGQSLGTNTCHADATFKDREGSYNCEYKLGYLGYGKSYMILTNVLKEQPLVTLILSALNL